MKYKTLNSSIIKDSEKLRIGLKKRWKECAMTQEGVAFDANSKGKIGIHRHAINKYLNRPYVKGALTDAHIIWLAWRWLVPVTMNVGIPDKSVKYTIPEKYDEKRALEMLEKIFPAVKKAEEKVIEKKIKKVVAKKAKKKKK